MDTELRREFRAFKTEVEDRLNRLEAAQQPAADEPKASSQSKKAGADTSTSEKDAN